MRKIERLMINAIRNRQDFKLANTEVICDPQNPNFAVSVYLHNSCIATFDDKHSLVFWSNCGYKTATTKSRLNAILGEFCNAGIYQKDFQWYAYRPQFSDELFVERGEHYGFAYAN